MPRVDGVKTFTSSTRCTNIVEERAHVFVQTFAFDYHRVEGADPTKRIVRDVDEFWQVIRYVEQFPEAAYDTETSGLAWQHTARIVGFSLTVRNPQGPGTLSWYFPFRHQTGEKQLPGDVTLKGLRAILENTRLGKIVHHAKFERHMAWMEGIRILGPLRDVMIEAHLYDENFNIGLKDRITRDLGDTAARAHEIILSKLLTERAKHAGMGKEAYTDRYGYATIPISIAGTYACYDTDGTLRLADFYDKHNIRGFFSETYADELELSEMFFEMEQIGVPVDVGYLRHLQRITAAAQEQLAPQVFSALNYKFNLGSDAELRDVLTQRMGLRLWKRTKQGDQFAVDKEVLESFAEDHPVCGLILEWRQANKIETTYTTGIIERLDANNILHGSFKSLGTNTGRTSSENPNMQNFAGDSDKRALAFSGKKLEDGGVDPWSVKRAFLCQRFPGWVRRFNDYSQIELRVLAHYSQDPVMLDVYATGEDIHNRTSMEVFGMLDKSMRRYAKVINFGLSYCLSSVGFARQAKIPEHEAEEHMRKFFERYSRIAPFREEFWSYVRQNNGCFRNLFGRPRRVPYINAQQGYMRGRGERQTIGALIQGTAGALMKKALIRINRWRKANSVEMLPCQLIHDDFQFDVHKSIADDVNREVVQMMEEFGDYFPNVPIEVDTESSETNWAEKKKHKLKKKPTRVMRRVA